MCVCVCVFVYVCVCVQILKLHNFVFYFGINGFRKSTKNSCGSKSSPNAIIVVGNVASMDDNTSSFASALVI